MRKTLSAVIIATLALVTFTTSSAEAGLLRKLAVGAVIGAALHHSFHHRERVYVVPRTVERVYVAPRPQVVYTRPDPEEQQAAAPAVAHNENSSIAVASADVADNQGPESVENIIVKKDKTAKPAKVAEASTDTGSVAPKRLDCKQFFPAVGMTLSVPCE